LAARVCAVSTMELEAREGFLVGAGLSPPGWWLDGCSGRLQWRRLAGSGARVRAPVIPSPRRGGMKLPGAVVAGAIRELGPRAGP
jgi:hypothetical protein